MYISRSGKRSKKGRTSIIHGDFLLVMGFALLLFSLLFYFVATVEVATPAENAQSPASLSRPVPPTTAAKNAPEN